MEDTRGPLAYRETPGPSPLRTMTLWRLPRHDGNTFAVRLDSRRLRQVAQSEVGRLDKSILMPDPVLFLLEGLNVCDQRPRKQRAQARCEAIPWISELCVIG